MALIPAEPRPMSSSDVDAVLGLERAIFPAPWTEQMLRDELRAPGRSYWVVEQRGVVVAYGGVMVVDQDAHVMTIAVAPSVRRHGLATTLMLRLIDDALASGAAHLTLELRLSNKAARALYEKFGFSPVGVRPRYYRDEDALVMWALDADGDEYAARLESIRREAA